MKMRIVVPVLLSTMASIAYGQAVPSGAGTPISSIGSGPNLPTLDGIFHYALSASEAIQYGYYGPGEVTHSTILSADAAYTGKSEVMPFNLVFAGGAILANQQAQGNSGYVSGTVSQGLITRRWAFNISDSPSFLPQSPTVGLSGIPGTGDLGALPVQGPVQGPAGGIFSNAGNRVANTLSGSVERQISRDTSLSGTGAWSILHFLDNSNVNGGLDSEQISGTVALNQRLDARSSASVAAVYSTFSYSGLNAGVAAPDIESRGLNVGYQRLLSRTLSVNFSVGPQWISSSNSTLIPSSLNVAATAALSYSRGFTFASLAYSHGVNAGSGVLICAVSDNIYASAGHNYGRNWIASLNAGYSHSSGLTQVTVTGIATPTHEVYNSVFGGVQLRRKFGNHFSGYVSYSAQNQSGSIPFAGQNALNGTSQTFGVGITFTPRLTRLGQF
ncbi:MAG: hypothetical protein ACRD3K_12175 [Edaphobacter sp.]